MQKFIPAFFFIVSTCTSLYGQKVSGKLQFVPGQTIKITIEVKNTIAQQAGAQAIDFSVNGSVIHYYKVIAATPGNTTLHHEVDRLKFQFHGMGQKRSFDSNNTIDKQTSFGKQYEEILGKDYDMVIDRAGNTLNTVPGEITWANQDERLIVITDMLKDLTGIVYPPKKGSASFFKILPEYEMAVGDSWTDTIITATGRSATINNILAMSDSAIIVGFRTVSSTIAHSEMMGTQARTNLSTITTGKIIIDRSTGILREKTSEAESNGSTEAMGGTLPITGKTSIIMRVKYGF